MFNTVDRKETQYPAVRQRPRKTYGESVEAEGAVLYLPPLITRVGRLELPFHHLRGWRENEFGDVHIGV